VPTGLLAFNVYVSKRRRCRQAMSHRVTLCILPISVLRCHGISITLLFCFLKFSWLIGFAVRVK